MCMWGDGQRTRRVPWAMSGWPWAHDGSLVSQAVGRAFLLSLLAAEEGGMVTSEVILQNWCYVLFWENQIYHMGSFFPLDGMGGKPRTSSHSLSPWCVACFSCRWLPLGWILMIAFPSEPLGLNFLSVSSDKIKRLHVFSLWKKVNTASILFFFFLPLLSLTQPLLPFSHADFDVWAAGLSQYACPWIFPALLKLPQVMSFHLSRQGWVLTWSTMLAWHLAPQWRPWSWQQTTVLWTRVSCRDYTCTLVSFLLFFCLCVGFFAWWLYKETNVFLVPRKIQRFWDLLQRPSLQRATG